MNRPTRKITFEKIGQNLYSIGSARLDRISRLQSRNLSGRFERDFFDICFGFLSIGIVNLGCSGGDDIDEAPLFAVTLALVSGLITSFADRLGFVTLVKVAWLVFIHEKL